MSTELEYPRGIFDILTRIDEILLDIKRILEDMRDLREVVREFTSIMQEVVKYYRERVELIRERERVEVPVVIPPPELPPPTPVVGVVFPARARLLDAMTVAVTDVDYEEVRLMGDGFIVVPDDVDVLIGVRPNDVDAFPLYKQMYWWLYRSDGMDRLYVKSRLGSGKVYFVFFELEER